MEGGEDEDWFHPLEAVGSREEAEDILLGGERRGATDEEVEGLFLVRESSTSSGDFVLSVVHDGQVIHYQIRRRDEDAFFSLADVSKVIHGLDELVHFYRYQENNGLQHSLTSFVPCSPCPLSVRLHGRENLLHRAAAAGDDRVVSELLGCGYRNLAAKNHDGQTAVHLAAFYGHAGVLRALVGASAGDARNKVSVNAVDSSGYTPLHFAAQANQPEAIRVLLGIGGEEEEEDSRSSLRVKANPVIQNQLTGWQPLHEAAWKGYESCCLSLIAGGSPIRPRTSKNETPADLARANGHHGLAATLDASQEEALSPEEEAAVAADWWGSATVSREEAIHAVTAGGRGDGTFLVRGSRKGRNVFVLTLLHENKTLHFEIIRQGIYYFMERGPYLPSLAHLVRHYSRYADGLPCRLRHPVSCLSATHPRPDAPPRVPRRDPLASPPSNLAHVDGRRRYENNASLRRVRHSRDAIPLESISLGAMIGEGEFGSVWEGEYLDADGNRQKVAVKRLGNTLEGQQREEFTKEAALMMVLDHQCVVRLIGNRVYFYSILMCRN